MCYVAADFFRSGCLGIDDGLAVVQSQHNNGNGTDDGSDRSGDPENGQQQPVSETSDYFVYVCLVIFFHKVTSSYRWKVIFFKYD